VVPAPAGVPVDRRVVVGLAERVVERAARVVFFFGFALFAVALPRPATLLELAVVLRADARVRFVEEARLRRWLEPFREVLPAFRRAVFFAMVL
jgi:hypothetical protein